MIISYLALFSDDTTKLMTFMLRSINIVANQPMNSQHHKRAMVKLLLGKCGGDF